MCSSRVVNEAEEEETDAALSHHGEKKRSAHKSLLERAWFFCHWV